jgi:hypothetical protein
MIILFAMKNSLEAHAGTSRRPNRPFDRAACGVCVGDEGKIKTQNRRFGGAHEQPNRDRRFVRRHHCGWEAAVMREGHCQPKPRRNSARRHSSGAVQRQRYDSGRAAGTSPADRFFGSSRKTPCSSKTPVHKDCD